MKAHRPFHTFFALIVLCFVSPQGRAEPDPSFHLYLLVGQSNMAGRGVVDEESKKVDARILMLTKGLEWQPATDPLHFDKPVAGVGPGLAFAKIVAEKTPSVRIGLIPCAVGGTSIDVWVPEALDKFTKTHPYSDMLERLKAAQKAGVLKGVLWHQGEADRKGVDTYGQRLKDLIARIRTDAGVEVPFVSSEISSFQPNTLDSTQQFNACVHSLEGMVKLYGCVSAAGLNHKGDSVHYDADSARILGARFAERMLQLQK